MVPRNTRIYNSTLENTQQLMKLITGPTGKEKMEKKLKCWVNSTKVSRGGCAGTGHWTGRQASLQPVEQRACLSRAPGTEPSGWLFLSRTRHRCDRACPRSTEGPSVFPSLNVGGPVARTPPSSCRTQNTSFTVHFYVSNISSWNFFVITLLCNCPVSHPSERSDEFFRLKNSP